MNRITPTPEQAVCCVALERDWHMYAFVYLAGRESEAMRWVGQSAADPRINFTWNDAARMCQVIRSGCRCEPKL